MGFFSLIAPIIIHMQLFRNFGVLHSKNKQWMSCKTIMQDQLRLSLGFVSSYQGVELTEIGSGLLFSGRCLIC
jgi:hypothetical protein